jgi:hypothetical protein
LRDHLAQVIGGEVFGQQAHRDESGPQVIGEQLQQLGVAQLLPRWQAKGAAGVLVDVGVHHTRHDDDDPDLRRVAAQVFDECFGEALDGELRRAVGGDRRAGLRWSASQWRPVVRGGGQQAVEPRRTPWPHSTVLKSDGASSKKA